MGPGGQTRTHFSPSFSLLLPALVAAVCFVAFGDRVSAESEVWDGRGSGYGDGSDDPCIDYHGLEYEQQCAFIRETDDCQNGNGFINYLKFLHCQFTASTQPLGLVLLFIWLSFLFVCLGVTAKNFFCPNLITIAKTLNMSDNLAGVTFLAFGNGAPDVFSAYAAITQSKDGNAGMAIGALFGAAVFITSFVAGTVSALKPFQVSQVPFLRDAIFVVGASFWTFYIMYTGEIRTAEAVGFIVLYLCYVAVVVIFSRFERSDPPTKPVEDGDNYDQEESFVGPASTGETPGEPAGDIGEREPLLPAHKDIVDFGSVDYGLPKVNCSPTVSCTAPDVPDEKPEAQNDVGTPASETTLEVSTIDEELSEEAPLLQQTEDPSGVVWQLGALFKALNPIDVDDWKSKNFFMKMFDIYKSPIKLLLRITVPLVLHDANNWNKLLSCIHLLISPAWCILITGAYVIVIAGGFVLWELMLCFGAILAILAFFTSKLNAAPVYYTKGFALFGFVVSGCWIYAIATEIVNLLKMVGIVFDLSDAILGLTFLAWGNCIGDLVSDTTMARQGAPNMALSACIGGPVFNLLIGIGVACTFASAQHDGTFKLKTDTLQFVLAGGLNVSLFISMFYMIAARFRATKVYAGLLYVVYAVFLTVAILTETKVLTW